jgi:hypothetical protein
MNTLNVKTLIQMIDELYHVNLFDPEKMRIWNEKHPGNGTPIEKLAHQAGLVAAEDSIPNVYWTLLVEVGCALGLQKGFHLDYILPAVRRLTTPTRRVSESDNSKPVVVTTDWYRWACSAIYKSQRGTVTGDLTPGLTTAVAGLKQMLEGESSTLPELLAQADLAIAEITRLDFELSMYKTAETVSKWPARKQNVLGTTPSQPFSNNMSAWPVITPREYKYPDTVHRYSADLTQWTAYSGVALEVSNG